MAGNAFSCSKCGRSFGMAAHLARHMSTIHARGGKKKKAAKKTGFRGRKGKRGRKKMARGPRSVAGVRLNDLSLDQLGNLISAARSEARRKIADFETSIG